MDSSSSQSPLTAGRLSSPPGRWLLVHYPLVEDTEKRNSPSFTPWAGKRARPFEQSKGVFHSWAGKRSVTRPFSNWAGKRASQDEIDGIQSTRWSSHSRSPWQFIHLSPARSEGEEKHRETDKKRERERPYSLNRLPFFFSFRNNATDLLQLLIVWINVSCKLTGLPSRETFLFHPTTLWDDISFLIPPEIMLHWLRMIRICLWLCILLLFCPLDAFFFSETTLRGRLFSSKSTHMPRENLWILIWFSFQQFQLMRLSFNRAENTHSKYDECYSLARQSQQESEIQVSKTWAWKSNECPSFNPATWRSAYRCPRGYRSNLST